MRGVKRMGRTYRAKNGVTEDVRFTVPMSAKPRTKERAASTPRKQEQNRNQAVHILGRILNNNFEQGDILLTLEYSWSEKKHLEIRTRERIGDGRIKKQDLEDAMLSESDRDADLFLRRCKEAGLSRVAKRVVIASDRDGDTGKQAENHVHIVLSGESFSLIGKKLTLNGKTLESIWGKGPVQYEFLRSGPLNKLAAYLIRQTRTIANRKKYRCSRSIERIIPEEYEIDPDADTGIHVPAGAEILERQENAESKYHMQYVRYLPRKQKSGPKAPRESQRKGGRRNE